MRKIFLSLLLILLPALFYGCVSVNQNAKKELLAIRKTVAHSKPEIQDSKHQSPNEKAVGKELDWLRSWVNNANPELKLESVPTRYVGMTEEMLLHKLGPPNESYVDRVKQIKVYTYTLDSPSRGGLFLKSLILPRMKVERTTLAIKIADGLVIDVGIGDYEKELSQPVPGILKLAPTAAVIIF